MENDEKKPRTLRGMSGQAMWAAFRGLLRTRIIAGVLTVIPIYITYVVVKFVFDLMRGATEPLARWVTDEYAKNPKSPLPAFFKEPISESGATRLDWMVPFVAVFLTLFFLYVLGLLTTNVFGRRTLSLMERLVDRLPIAKTVYRATKQIVTRVAGGTDVSRSRVVLVDFPRPGVKALGFLNSIIRDKDTGRDLAAVFIANTPNPTVGFMQILPIEQVWETDISIEEAVRFVMSGGVLSPEQLRFDRARPLRPGAAGRAEAGPASGVGLRDPAPREA